MIVQKQVRNTTSQNRVDLEVESAGLLITVKAGTCLFGGQSHELLEDETFECRLPTSDVQWNGVLVWDPTAEELRLLVETLDSDTEPFDFQASPFTPLHELFEARAEAGVENLDAVELFVRHIGMAVKPPKTRIDKETARKLRTARIAARKAARLEEEG